MRFLKIIVIVNGLLIVGVVGLFVWAFQRDARRQEAAGHWTQNLPLPPGASIAGVAAIGDQMAVHVNDGAGGRIILLNPRTGRQTGIVQVGQ
jgi:Family of unknown function (DUF6476)